MKIWKDLRHPNILPFIGTVTLHLKEYLVSPWMENGNLHDYLKRNQHNSGLNFVALLLQVARGLEYLHTFIPVIVHGDIKSLNIFISSNGDARIGDFGLSRRVLDGGSAGFSTTWRYAGNPRWQSPELIKAQTADEARRTKESDMFAFGRVIIEVYTMDYPFAYMPDGTSVTAYMLRGNLLPIRPQDPEVLARGLDNKMWGIVKDCCRKLPARRVTVQVAIRRLEAILSKRG
ncbi:hypothetical protein BOTBODRAFT_258809 [Botryobasidium botryosum FD-172 SS1]|uniref:Protein kinase domain-containing protein n=1 Tax=Botryobasidium botryosum (strain FD-172 SS1) TaxID=930990 RepID=A0A067MXK9_BOTB1|nr:hypothetical protein BOTBODRAFT_258809 [Botryobasidium botryosum FD-172 SS1]